MKPIKTPEETAGEFGLTYSPVRNYHTRRVKKLRGNGIIDRFKFLYEYDVEFRLQTDLSIGIGFSFVAAIGIVTILILTIG